MSSGLASLIAVVPVLVALGLLLALRWPAARAMPATGAATAALAIAAWQVAPVRVIAAALEGLVIAASIGLILFGALLLTGQLRRAGALARIQGWITGRSADRRLQVVLVAWLLGSLVEGAAGFGTPAALTAPLLVAIGFSPLQAVVLALVGDSVAVSFGAVGTPMVVGMGEALAGVDGAPTADAIARQVTRLDLVAGSVMPLVLVLTVTVGARGRAGLRDGLGAAPFALAVGLAHTAAAMGAAHLVGPELPSLIGPLVGLLVAQALLATGWLVPRRPWRLPDDPAPDGLAVAAAAPAPDQAGGAATPSLARAVAPYVGLIALLVVTRVRELPVGAWLRAVEVGGRDLLEAASTPGSSRCPRPASLLVVVAVATVLGSAAALRARRQRPRRCARVLAPGRLALAAAVINSPSAYLHLGQRRRPAGDAALRSPTAALAGATGAAWPVVAPWIGALGSFLAGSATFSNMLFAQVQHAVATATGLEPTRVLALQAMGAAAGNLVAIHNVVAASAVVGLVGAEGAVIRRTLAPMAIYVVLAGVVGLAAGALG
ncbi:MAG: L-lactate permease [Kofleriaceae bacterium]|nr:L-lactate permease [Kofleriaceae bacterium]